MGSASKLREARCSSCFKGWGAKIGGERKMGMRREAGSLVRWGARAKRCLHAILPFVRWTLYSELLQPFAIPHLQVHSQKCWNCPLFRCGFIYAVPCILLFITLAQESGQALSKCSTSVPLPKSKLNLHWVCNRESTQHHMLYRKRLNMISCIPTGVYHATIRLGVTALSDHP